MDLRRPSAPLGEGSLVNQFSWMKNAPTMPREPGTGIRGFLKLVAILFVVLLISILVLTFFGDSQGTMNFSYDGFG